MRPLILILALFAQPFWETRSAVQWTDEELRRVLNDSPWAQPVGPQPPLVAYFATARPVEEAERELARRARLGKGPAAPVPDADADSEYAEYLRDHRDSDFLLAIPYPASTVLGDEREWKRLEEESVMKVGKKTYGIDGYFPPTPSDPVLRLAFPRKVDAADKTVLFRLYVPGVNYPEREAEFKVKELTYRGKLEM